MGGIPRPLSPQSGRNFCGHLDPANRSRQHGAV